MTFRARLSQTYNALTWQDKTVILLLLLFLIIQAYTITQYEHLPNPLFGGDWYRDRGFVQHVANGHMPWEDGYYVGEVQYYSWALFGVQGFLVTITGTSVESVMWVFTLLSTIGLVSAWYFFGTAFFRDKTWGLLLSLLMLVVTNIFPGVKSSTFALMVLLPFFFYFWLRLEQTKKKKYSYLAGLMLGLAALVHGGRFLTGAGIFAVTIIILFGKDLFVKKIKETITIYLKKYLPLVIVVVLLSSPYFLPLYFTYGTEQPNPVTKYGDTHIDQLGISWLGKQIKNTFFNTNNIFRLVIGLIAIIGILHAVINRKQKHYQLILLWLVANLLIMQHHLITKPLLDEWFLPQKLVYLLPLSLIFSVIGCKAIHTYLQKRINTKQYLAILFVILILPTAVLAVQQHHQGRWVQYGKTPPALAEAMLADVGPWLQHNLGAEESILAHDETSFALAAVSGRHVMITRRTHANYFVDIDRRIADAVIILYSDNIAKVEELSNKYEVRYVLIDGQLIQRPLLTRPEFSSLLDQHNITYAKQQVPLDPAQTEQTGYTQDMLIIIPQERGQGFISSFAPDTSFTIGTETYLQVYKRNT